MNPIKKVTMLGAGVMGPGIAQILAMAGAQVTLYDIVPEALDRARDTYRANLNTFMEEGLIRRDQAASLLAQLSCEPDLKKALDGAELVVEAVVEKKAAKESVYAQLDELLPPEIGRAHV